MIRARQHCCNRYGWLFCHRDHYQTAYEQQMRMVEAELQRDRTFSGEPPAFEQWTEEQLRGLAFESFYSDQIQVQAEKLQQQADATVEQLERIAAELSAKAEALIAERNHILSFLEESSAS